MLTQTIKFTDFVGRPRETEVYFNLNKLEIIELQLEYPGGLEKALQEIMDSENNKEALAFVKDLVNRSYGIISENGVNFEKKPEHLEKFVSAAYYDDFLLDLFGNGGQKGFDFIKGILPAALVKEAMNDIANDSGYQPSAKERFDARQREKNMPAPTYTEAPTMQKSAADYEVTTARTGTEPVDPDSEFTQEELDEFKAWQKSRKMQSQRQAQDPDEEGVLIQRPIHQNIVHDLPDGEIPIRRRRGIPDNPQA